MATARVIVGDALTFGLNRLSPGETLDPDTAAVCLRALNSVVDDFNGLKAYLFRSVLTDGTVTGATGTLGATWAGLASGDSIIGASYSNGSDVPISPITLRQYQAIPAKTAGGQPMVYAHDGAATVFFYPAPTAAVVTLLTKAAFADFADLDTEYSMPAGFRSAFSALVAEKLAPPLLGGISPAIASNARAARTRLGAQMVDPAIIGSAAGVRGTILTGW